MSYVTSVSSYSAKMPQIERGYNRDGKDLPQYNLGMFCDEESCIPLYYNRYNGSLTDRTNFSYVLANARELGIHRVKMILDGGFWSEECIQSFADSCEAFTIGMPSHLKKVQTVLSHCRNGIETFANEVPGFLWTTEVIERDKLFLSQPGLEILEKVCRYYSTFRYYCEH